MVSRRHLLSTIALIGFLSALPLALMAKSQTPDLFKGAPAATPLPNRTPDLFKGAPAATPLPSPATSELSITTLEQTVYEQVNQHRSRIGLPALRLDPRLSSIARKHSQEMANREIPFGHTGLRKRALKVNGVIRSRRVSETVAYIFTHKDTAQRAVQGWLKSSNHRPTLEGNFKFTGVGVAQGDRGAFYFTQIYVRPR